MQPQPPATGIISKAGRAVPAIGEAIRVASPLVSEQINGRTPTTGERVMESGAQLAGVGPRMAATYTGAALGSAFGPLGTVAGGVGGYIAGDQGVEAVRQNLSPQGTDAYYERLGWDPRDASFGRDLAARSLGVLSDIGGAITPGGLEDRFADRQPMSQTQIRRGAERVLADTQGPIEAPDPKQIESLRSQLAQDQARLAQLQAPTESQRRITGGIPMSTEESRDLQESIQGRQQRLADLLTRQEAAQRSANRPAQEAERAVEQQIGQPVRESPMVSRSEMTPQQKASNDAARQRVLRDTPVIGGGQQALNAPDTRVGKAYSDQVPLYRVTGEDGSVTFTQDPNAGGTPVTFAPEPPRSGQAPAVDRGAGQQDRGQRQLLAMLGQSRADRMNVASGAQNRLGRLYKAFDEQIAQGRRRTAAVIGEQIRAELGVLGQTASGQMIDPRQPDRTAEMLRAQADAGLLGEQTQGARMENAARQRIARLEQIIADPNTSEEARTQAQSQYQALTQQRQQQQEGRVVNIQTPEGEIPMFVPPGQSTGVPITVDPAFRDSQINAAREAAAAGADKEQLAAELQRMGIFINPNQLGQQ